MNLNKNRGLKDACCESMKYMKFVIYIFRTLLAILISFILFISLPALHIIFGNRLMKNNAESNSLTIIMQVQPPKQKKKKLEKLKPRKIKSSLGRKQKTSSSMKFTPDLGVGSGDGVGISESNLENVIFEEGEADVSATPIKRTPIPYPRRAKEAGIEGVVQMILLIDRSGKVANIEFTKVPHEMFKKSIIKIINQWKFKPAMNKGVPVKMRVRQNIEFNLDN